MFTVLIAGLASFFSPCVVPLATGYITYITGAIVESDLEGKKLFVFVRTLAFVLGFTLIFTLLGFTATSLGVFLNVYRDIIMKIGGIFLVLLGLSMMGVLNFKITGKKVKFPVNVGSIPSSFLVGLAFGIGWTPCVGAILGSVLIYAGSQDEVAKGAFLLFIYSVGMSIPFLISSLFIGKVGLLWKKVGKYTSLINKIMGILIISIGILMFFDLLSKLFPAS